MTDPNQRDCPLSDIGVQQCERANEYAKELKVKYVFVSPLRRALETAWRVFKDHPSPIKYVILPDLRENQHSTCDIPNPIAEVKAEYLDRFPDSDWSAMDKFEDQNHWFVEGFQADL